MLQKLINNIQINFFIRFILIPLKSQFKIFISRYIKLRMHKILQIYKREKIYSIIFIISR